MNHPRGYLVAIRGTSTRNHNRPEGQLDLDLAEPAILEHIVEHLKGRDPVLEIVTSNSTVQDVVFKEYKKAFKKLGFTNVQHVNLPDRKAADDEKKLQRFEKCSGVLFACDSALKLCSVLGGTLLIELLQERYQAEAFVLAGVGAGAAAFGDVTINEGDSTKSFLKGEVNISIGLGFINNVIIDARFDTVGRFGRVVQTIAEQPGSIYAGLAEDTGIVVEKGTRMKAIGSRCVTLIDGSRVQHNNIATIKRGVPISMANLVVHLMAEEDEYNLHTREFIAMEVEDVKKDS